MALKTFVKIGNVTNLSDARYCAGMGADLLGFPIEAHKDNYVNPTTFAEITQWVSGPLFVGECTTSEAAEIKLIALDYPVDYIQTSLIENLEPLSALNIPLILKQSVSKQNIDGIESLITYANELTDYIILHFDISLFPEINALVRPFQESNVLVDSGWTTQSAHAILDSHFTGMEIHASEEEQPGFKDYGQVMDILETLEVVN